MNLQKESWEWFWKQGLKELFAEISPIRDHTGKEFELWFQNYKSEEPKYKNDLDAKKNNDSYEAAMRVNVKLVNLKTKEIKEQEVFLTDFPIMTDRRTFIVNGVERVAISQLIRSSGVFFTSENIQGKNCFGAKLIPNRGAWLEFETDMAGVMWVKIDRKRKVPATVALKAFGGFSENDIKELLQGVDRGDIRYIEETLKKDTTKNQGEALIEMYRRLRPGDLVTPDTAKELIENTFFNFERYDLSKVGRWRMLKRLPSLKIKTQKSVSKSGEVEITVQDRILKLEDVVEVIKEIIKLNNDPQAKADQIDHLGNRRVRTLAEFLQNRLRVGLMRMERFIKDRI